MGYVLVLSLFLNISGYPTEIGTVRLYAGPTIEDCHKLLADLQKRLIVVGQPKIVVEPSCERQRTA